MAEAYVSIYLCVSVILFKNEEILQNSNITADWEDFPKAKNSSWYDLYILPQNKGKESALLYLSKEYSVLDKIGK